MSILKIKDSQGNWVGVPTVKGDTGNGISSAILNDDYTLTLTFTNGTTYTTPSIRGEKGEKGEPATDMEIHICSASEDGVANVPIASIADQNAGLVKLKNSRGYAINGNDGTLFLDIASDNNIKDANNTYKVISASNAYKSTFYGLAKAAGDTTQSQSSNAVGNYTDNAKDSIQNMLGITPLIASHETDPFESNHVVGELFIIGGKLYRAKTALTAGEYVNEGTNVEVVSVAGVLDSKVGDVQANGVSIVSNGIANLTVTRGLSVNSNSGSIGVNPASLANVKAGTDQYLPLTSEKASIAAFYGLAKASGDVSQKTSDNPVGTYTDEAKSAIKQMLSIADNYDSFIVNVEGTDPTITGQPSYRYNCGEVLSLTVTAPETGTIDFRFTSGSSPTVLTLPSTVKMPEWWVEVEANTIYEMCITDGVYCGVMSWAM